MKSLPAELRALGTSWPLLRLMVRRELAARHAGSVGGIGWAYVQPLLTMAAYYFMFDVVFKARLAESAPTRAVGAFLIVGMLPWQAFCEATSRASASLLDAADLLQKNPLPLVLFPMRAVLAAAAVYLPLFVLLILAYTPLHRFGIGMFALPVWLAFQLLLCFLLGYLLSVLAAAMRDVLQMLGFVLNIGIFASPILFPASMFPESLRWLLWLNPMTPLVEGYQAILLQGALPNASAWIACLAWLAGLALVLDQMLSHAREQIVDWL